MGDLVTCLLTMIDELTCYWPYANVPWNHLQKVKLIDVTHIL